MFKSIFKYLRTIFLAGLLVTVPIIATVLALKFLFTTIDGLVGSLPQKLFGYHVPGLGVLVTTLVVLITGFLASNFFGKKIIEITDKFFARIPFVNIVYSAAKEFMQAVTVPSHMSFKEVVLVEYPAEGRYAIGFLTSRTERITPQGRERLANVFIPTVPVVTTGFLILFPENEVVTIKLSIEKAIKMVMSGGIVAPGVIEQIVPRHGTKETGATERS
ncbi:MAG: DUF502 domain-containing protein [Candidatus Zhuqueibacterota bacterium]